MSLHHSPDKHYIADLEQYDATRLTFGEGAFSQLSAELLLNRDNSLSIVVGGQKSAMDSGAYHAYVTMCHGFDLEASIIRGIPEEPTVADVRRIVDELKLERPARLAAVGGGSVMDAAKAAYLSWQTGLDVTELFGAGVVSKKFPGRHFDRVICIPTTAGTGSEVTPYANIVDPERGVKCLIMDDQIVPELSFVDPTFTESMPVSLTAATGTDAMVHAIESLLNTNAANADPKAEDWAVEAVRMIHYALPVALREPKNHLAREMMSAAAVLGGMCIKNRPTSLPHLCSFSLFGKVPHGIAVGAFLVPFWRYYLTEPAVRERTMRLAGIFDSGRTQTTPEAVVDAVAEFLRDTAGIDGLASLNLNAGLMEKIALDAVKNPVKLASAPRAVPMDRAASVITGILSAAN